MDGRGHTLEEVCRQFGVTPERVRQIEKLALERLYRSGDAGERQGSPALGLQAGREDLSMDQADRSLYLAVAIRARVTIRPVTPSR